MSTIRKREILDSVKEITVAMLSNTSTKADAESGKDVADFMQAVYDKLTKLTEENN